MSVPRTQHPKNCTKSGLSGLKSFNIFPKIIHEVVVASEATKVTRELVPDTGGARHPPHRFGN